MSEESNQQKLEREMGNFMNLADIQPYSAGSNSKIIIATIPEDESRVSLKDMNEKPVKTLIVKKTNESLESMEEEINIMASLFVKSYDYSYGQAISPQIFYCCETRNDDDLQITSFIIMEYVGPTSLLYICNNTREIESKKNYICMGLSIIIEMALNLGIMTDDFHFNNIIINVDDEDFFSTDEETHQKVKGRPYLIDLERIVNIEDKMKEEEEEEEDEDEDTTLQLLFDEKYIAWIEKNYPLENYLQKFLYAEINQLEKELDTKIKYYLKQRKKQIEENRKNNSNFKSQNIKINEMYAVLFKPCPENILVNEINSDLVVPAKLVPKKRKRLR